MRTRATGVSPRGDSCDIVGGSCSWSDTCADDTRLFEGGHPAARHHLVTSVGERQVFERRRSGPTPVCMSTPIIVDSCVERLPNNIQGAHTRPGAIRAPASSHRTTSDSQSSPYRSTPRRSAVCASRTQFQESEQEQLTVDAAASVVKKNGESQEPAAHDRHHAPASRLTPHRLNVRPWSFRTKFVSNPVARRRTGREEAMSGSPDELNRSS